MTKKDRIKKLLRYLWQAQKIQKPSNIINFGKKRQLFLLFAVSVAMKMKRYLKRKKNTSFKTSWLNWKYIITLKM